MNKYSTARTEQIDGIAAIRLRPQMYVGDTASRGLHWLAFQLFDNSIDEFIAGESTGFDVRIHADGSLTCSDDGRGAGVAPISALGDRSQLEVALSEIWAGGRFNQDCEYRTGSGGLHGIGVTVVNALSRRLRAEVWRDGSAWAIEFQRGRVNRPLYRIGPAAGRGIAVCYLPDDEIFTETTFASAIIEDRLREIAFLNAGARLNLVDERDGRSKAFHAPKGLPDFVRYLNSANVPLYDDIVHICETSESIKIDVALQQHSGFSTELVTYVNNVKTEEGGSHQDGMARAFADAVAAYAREHHILLGSGTGSEARLEGLTAVVSVWVLEASYEGPTRTRLGNPEVGAAVYSVVRRGLDRIFQQSSALAEQITTKALGGQAA